MEEARRLRNEVSLMKVQDMKAILRSVGWKVTGRKQELFARLTDPLFDGSPQRRSDQSIIFAAIKRFTTRSPAEITHSLQTQPPSASISTAEVASILPPNVSVDDYCDSVRVLAGPVLLQSGSAKFQLPFSAAMAAEVRATGAFMDRSGVGCLRVHLWGFASSDAGRTHCWPLRTTVKVNSAQVRIRQRKSFTELGVSKVKGFCQPVDVFQYLNAGGSLNQIEVQSDDDSLGPFQVVLQLTRKISVDELVERVKSRVRPSKEEAAATVRASFRSSSSSGSGGSSKEATGANDDDDDDDDVTAAATNLQLACPIGLCPIEIPVRGRQCAHLQCFDLKTFLALSEKNSVSRFRCGVCALRVRVPDLVVDPYFADIIDQCRQKQRNDSTDESDEAPREVQIQPDASWCMVGEEEGPDTPPQSTAATSPPFSSPATRRLASSSSSTSSLPPSSLSSSPSLPSLSSSSSSSSSSVSSLLPPSSLQGSSEASLNLVPSSQNANQFVDLATTGDDDDDDDDDEATAAAPAAPANDEPSRKRYRISSGLNFATGR